MNIKHTLIFKNFGGLKAEILGKPKWGIFLDTLYKTEIYQQLCKLVFLPNYKSP